MCGLCLHLTNAERLVATVDLFETPPVASLNLLSTDCKVSRFLNFLLFPQIDNIAGHDVNS